MRTVKHRIAAAAACSTIVCLVLAALSGSEVWLALAGLEMAVGVMVGFLPLGARVRRELVAALAVDGADDDLRDARAVEQPIIPGKRNRREGALALLSVLAMGGWLVAKLPLPGLPESLVDALHRQIGPITSGQLYGLLGIGFAVVVLPIFLVDEAGVRRGVVQDPADDN